MSDHERLNAIGAALEATNQQLQNALPTAAEAAREIEQLNAAWNECSADKHRLLKEVRALDAEVERLQARERELEAAVDAVRNLINNSEGVAGLHLNGDVAPWDDLLEGGEYEVWLSALAAVSAEKGAKTPDMEPGDYVLATKYHDGDPGDQWAVGFYARTYKGDRHIVNDADGQPFRANGFRRVERITAEAGDWLLARKELIGSGHASLWEWLEEAVSAEKEAWKPSREVSTRIAGLIADPPEPNAALTKLLTETEDDDET